MQDVFWLFIASGSISVWIIAIPRLINGGMVEFEILLFNEWRTLFFAFIIGGIVGIVILHFLNSNREAMSLPQQTSSFK